MKVTTDACLFGGWVAETIGIELTGSDKLLDIGTGTGLLSLMVAQKTSAIIDAIEIDSLAAQQARENIAASPWNEKISVIEGDVLQHHFNRKYHCIISNPPFYENSLKSDKRSKNIAHHNEGLRLDGLLSVIDLQLLSDGSFFLLLPAQREREFTEAANKGGFFLQEKRLVTQTPMHQPFRTMVHCSRNKVNPATTKTLSIKDQNDNYSPAFVALLKDYYLHL